MRHLQLAALTLLCTVVMSMCLMVNEAPPRQPASGPGFQQTPPALPRALEQQLLELRDQEDFSAPLPSSSSPESTVQPDLPPALEQLRLLELGARNMILY
jgi:hypothetical protein